MNAKQEQKAMHLEDAMLRRAVAVIRYELRREGAENEEL